MGSTTRGSARLRTCPGSAADGLRREAGSRGLGEASQRGAPQRLENEAEAVESAVCRLEEPTPVFYSTLGGNWMQK